MPQLVIIVICKVKFSLGFAAWVPFGNGNAMSYAEKYKQHSKTTMGTIYMFAICTIL